MFLTRLLKREKYLLYASVAIVVFVFLDKIIFSPVLSVLDSLNKEILSNEKKLEDSVLILNKEDSVTSNYLKKINNLEKISSNEEEVSAMSSEIERLARKSSVLIKNIKPFPVVEEKLYFKYKIGIDAEASMVHLIDFIYQLERSPQLYKVKRLSLVSQKKDLDTLRVSLLITKILIP